MCHLISRLNLRYSVEEALNLQKVIAYH